MSALERLVLATVEHLQGALPEGATIVTATSLPRGADPLAGGERPMLCAGMRLAALPPAGVVLAGGPAGLAQLLGFTVPERPEAPAAEPGAPAGEAEGEAEGADADAEAEAPPPPASEAEGDDAEEGDGDGAGAPAASAEAPVAGPSWASQLTDAARPAVSPFLTDLAHAIAGLAALPIECTPVRLELTEQPRSVVGPVPDGLVVVIDIGGQEVRVVVVASGVLLARMDAAVGAPPSEGSEADAADDAAPRDGAGIERTLTEVPLDIALRVGRVHAPLASVTRLRDGDLLELEAAPDDPVELVAGTTPVASGTLEVSPEGTLQLLVTRVDEAVAGGLPPRTPHAAVNHGDSQPGAPSLVAIDGSGAGETVPAADHAGDAAAASPEVPGTDGDDGAPAA